MLRGFQKIYKCRGNLILEPVGRIPRTRWFVSNPPKLPFVHSIPSATFHARAQHPYPDAGSSLDCALCAAMTVKLISQFREPSLSLRLRRRPSGNGILESAAGAEIPQHSLVVGRIERSSHLQHPSGKLITAAMASCSGVGAQTVVKSCTFRTASVRSSLARAYLIRQPVTAKVFQTCNRYRALRHGEMWQ